MTIRKIICWFKGHEYRIFTVQHHNQTKKEYQYRCIRCGRRTKYCNILDECSDHLLIHCIERILLK